MVPPFIRRHLESFLSLFVFGVCLAVYLTTVAPRVTFIDSGELAAVASTLGVAHPTGYPLFTLLGWCVSKVPIAATEIVRLNVLTAILTALGTLVFFRAMVAIQLSCYGQRQDDRTMPLLASSLSASFILAFSRTYWSQSTSIEVYSLHCVFLAAILYSIVKALRSRHNMRWWSVVGFLLGLSFTNHMTTVLLIPGLLLLFGSEFRKRRDLLRGAGSLVIPFFLGLSLYLYLPIRAADDPVLNWGNPQTFERFLWHVSGKQYRVWMFSSLDIAGRQLQYFLEHLPSEFAYVPLLFALLGIWVLLRRNKRWFWFTLLLFVTCVLYSINYDIHEIDPYFLLSYFMIAMWAGIGVRFAIDEFVLRSTFNTFGAFGTM